MSIRPVKRVIKSKPTLEGAGVHLRRAFGFGNTSDFDPWTISATTFLRIIWLGSRGTLIAGSKPSRMSWRELLSTAIAWETAVPSRPATFNG